VERIAPGGFNDAQKVADRFKAGQAVAMDLGDVDRELARRLIDFCSGLCYASNGNMERVGAQVYLISPGGVEVPAEERRRLGGEAAPASGR
jgi:cell division inhibitor SepF